MCAFTLVLGACTLALGQGEIVGLKPFLPAGAVNISVRGISGDGSHVLLTAYAPTFKMFIWSRDGGMTELPALPEGQIYRMTGLSYDGASFAATYSSLGTFRYRLGETAYEVLSVPESSQVVGMSADGARLLLRDYRGGAPYEYHALLWEEATGLRDIGLAPGLLYTYANILSPNGRVVMGGGIQMDQVPAWRWDEESGFAILDDLPGGNLHGIPLASAIDGGVIVGASSSSQSATPNPFRLEACRWGSKTGIIPLGDVPGGIFNSDAIAVSGDGSLVLCYGSGPIHSDSFLWSAERGMKLLSDVLVDDYGFGETASQWLFQSPSGMSNDGMTIVGTGHNPRGEPDAWVVSLDGPWPCGADFNRDGFVNSQDFFDYLMCVFDPSSGPSCPPDFNHDGISNSSDVYLFIDAFLRGCG